MWDLLYFAHLTSSEITQKRLDFGVMISALRPTACHQFEYEN